MTKVTHHFGANAFGWQSGLWSTQVWTFGKRYQWWRQGCRVSVWHSPPQLPRPTHAASVCQRTSRTSFAWVAFNVQRTLKRPPPLTCLVEAMPSMWMKEALPFSGSNSAESSLLALLKSLEELWNKIHCTVSIFPFKIQIFHPKHPERQVTPTQNPLWVFVFEVQHFWREGLWLMSLKLKASEKFF